MADTNLPLTGEPDFDDLPRTLRRERERQAASASATTFHVENEDYEARYEDEPVPAAVRRIDMPFFSLMSFFLKAVVAAIPALFVLGVILWFAGQGLKAFFPDLVHTKIVISFPEGS